VEPLQNIQLTDALLALGGCMAVSLVGAIALLVVAARQVAEIEVPEGADFFETLQIVPITVPLALDLLDMAFDVFSAPISWIILELLGLRALQTITVFESLIPGTQLIPTLTIAWFIAKAMKKKVRQSPLRGALRDYQLQSQGQFGRLGGPTGDLAERYRRKALLPAGDEPLEDGMIDGEYDDIDGVADVLDEEENEY
jgi:hypothetical protein